MIMKKIKKIRKSLLLQYVATYKKNNMKKKG